MKTSKNRLSAKSIAILMVLAITFTIFALPLVNAHVPPIQMPSFPYLVASPNPVGAGQRVLIVMWVDKPLPESAVTNDIRRHDYTMTITKPDGKTVSEHWDVVQDTTSIQYYQYFPDLVGDYTIKFDYGGQVYTWNATANQRIWTGDTFKATTKTITLKVQEEKLPESRSSYPLPTEYWTRPIEGQNTDWWSISSNWLSGAHIVERYQADGTAPNSPHIMWSKPIKDGGVVGGTREGVAGNTYYSGMAYQAAFDNPIIIHGRLYYAEPRYQTGTGDGYMAVDLRTGEEIWSVKRSAANPFPWDGTSIGVASFGQLLDFETGNQHGILPNGFLWRVVSAGATNTWMGYDPEDSRFLFNLTNAPPAGAGFGQITGPGTLYGPSGEILQYVLNTQGNWLAMWNSTAGIVGTGFSGATIPASGFYNTSNAYTWNSTLSSTLPATATIRGAYLDDVMLVSDITARYGTGFTIFGTIDPYTVAAISTKPGTLGQVLWKKTYTAPNNLTRQWANSDPVNRIFVMKDVETMTFSGYSMDTGEQVWGPTPSQPDFDYFNLQSFVRYNTLYSSGYGGVIFAYDIKTGNLKWTYGNGGPGNSTFAGLETAWGSYPTFIMAIADGKLYTATYEHSPNSPHYKDMRIRAVNATDGAEIWTLLGAGSAFEAGQKGFAIADGYAVFLNAYDMQIYAVGKGPSAMTVEAPATAFTFGNSVVIRGTVTDVAAGTKQKEQAARFPNGVPAVSDESQGAWMEYVYMQKPRPTDTTGVEVVLSVLDANNNFREIGTSTSNSDGFFTFNWTPDIEGAYTVYASFAGSESYWPSHAVTSFAVDPAPPAAPQEPEAPPDMTGTYVMYAAIAIIVVIVICSAVILLVLRKRP